MNIGEKAPGFVLKDQDGEEHSLSDYLGSYVLLYFYPKDDTPGCTVEANSIKDKYDEFNKKNIVVLGVSSDSVESHKNFEQKYKLPFILLSDGDKKVIELYGLTGRDSFLIDTEGNIKNIYKGVKPEEHSEEVLKSIVG